MRKAIDNNVKWEGTCSLGLTDCSGKSDKADITNIMEISGLVIEKEYTEEEFQDNVLGKNRDDIMIQGEKA